MPTKAQMDTIMQGRMRFGQELHASGKMVVGERLRPDSDASRIRVKAGHRQVMDGPAATKEALGGFYLIEAATKEEAVEWGKKIPLLEGGFIERGPRLADVGLAYHVCSWDPAPTGGRYAAVQAGITEAFRLEYARVVASVLRIVRDIDTAEEAVPGGLRPGAHQLARGRDAHPARARGSSRRRGGERSIISAGAGGPRPAPTRCATESALDAPDEYVPEYVTDPEAITDDRLRLIFTCCHPGLPAESRVALTLRLVGGLSTTEITAPSWSRSRRSRSGWCRPAKHPGPRATVRGTRADELPNVYHRAGRDLSDLQRGLRAHAGEALVRHDLVEEPSASGRCSPS